MTAQKKKETVSDVKNRIRSQVVKELEAEDIHRYSMPLGRLLDLTREIVDRRFSQEVQKMTRRQRDELFSRTTRSR